MKAAEDILKEAQAEVAKKHGLGSTLVTGHKASYFTEASLLAMYKVAEQSWVAGKAYAGSWANDPIPDKSTYMNNLFPKI